MILSFQSLLTIYFKLYFILDVALQVFFYICHSFLVLVCLFRIYRVFFPVICTCCKALCDAGFNECYLSFCITPATSGEVHLSIFACWAQHRTLRNSTSNQFVHEL